MSRLNSNFTASDLVRVTSDREITDPLPGKILSVPAKTLDAIPQNLKMF
jgi:hypothetical protein